MSKETPLTTAMAEMIDNEYREEAMQQEQEGGAWHSVVRTGKALSWDALLDKLLKPAVDRERIGEYGGEKSEPVPTRMRPVPPVRPPAGGAIPPPDAPDPVLTMFVHVSASMMRPFTLRVRMGETVRSVKEMIQDKDNSLEPDLLRMRYAGVECQDGATLAEINFCDATRVTVDRLFARTSRASTSGATHVEQEEEAAE